MAKTGVGQQHQNEQGNALSRHRAERTCIGCRAQREVHDLLRLACTPQGEVILDASGHAPGRGLYVCCDSICLRKALKPAKLALALKRPVTIPDFDAVYQDVRRLLYTRLRTCLSLGQKAGTVVSGYTQLRQAFAQARVLYMVLAEDIATGRDEEYRSWCTQHGVPYVTLFTKVELGHIIGKPSRSAAGLTAPHFLKLLLSRLTSLERLQTAYHRA
jgi:predicted RNA-binding protein YlxR (DUF448 family)/ribosomal protein L7Ae-like RNA K-turn-binding protein